VRRSTFNLNSDTASNAGVTEPALDDGEIEEDVADVKEELYVAKDVDELGTVEASEEVLSIKKFVSRLLIADGICREKQQQSKMWKPRSTSHLNHRLQRPYLQPVAVPRLIKEYIANLDYSAR
jgi:hypothetical protein